MHTRMLRSRGMRRLAGGLTAAGAAVATVLGLVAAVPAPATAATNGNVPYLLFASGYGTTVKAPQLGVSSGPSAWITTGCTHRVPRTLSNDVASVDTGTNQISIGAVTSVVRSYRGKIGGLGSTVSRSVNDVASVAVGDPSTLQLQIKGLRGVSMAWVNRKGFHASSSLSLGDVALIGPNASNLGPVGDLLNGPVKQVLGALDQGPIVIPGLAQVSLGRVSHAVRQHASAAGTYALVIDVFANPGQQQAADKATDTIVTVGRSYARVTDYDYTGYFSGRAYGVQAQLLNGVAGLGQQVLEPLRCQGTNGAVESYSLAAVNLANAGALQIGGVRSSAYGAHWKSGKGSTAWTGSTIADIKLSDQLELKAIAVRTKVWSGRDRRIHRRVVQSIGSITAGGKQYAAPSPGQSLTIPGVATIEVPKPVRTRTGVGATAVRLTLLGGTQGQTVIDLASSVVNLRH